MKNVKRKVNGCIEVMRHLTHFQGYAGLSTFDSGISEDADDCHYAIHVNLERDGLILKRENLTRQEFRELLVNLLEPKS